MPQPVRLIRDGSAAHAAPFSLVVSDSRRFRLRHIARFAVAHRHVITVVHTPCFCFYHTGTAGATTGGIHICRYLADPAPLWFVCFCHPFTRSFPASSASNGFIHPAIRADSFSRTGSGTLLFSTSRFSRISYTWRKFARSAIWFSLRHRER